MYNIEFTLEFTPLVADRISGINMHLKGVLMLASVLVLAKIKTVAFVLGPPVARCSGMTSIVSLSANSRATTVYSRSVRSFRAPNAVKTPQQGLHMHAHATTCIIATRYSGDFSFSLFRELSPPPTSLSSPIYFSCSSPPPLLFRLPARFLSLSISLILYLFHTHTPYGSRSASSRA